MRTGHAHPRRPHAIARRESSFGRRRGKAAAARQAAEVRGRLMSSGPEMDSELSPEASWSVGRWPERKFGGQEGQGREQSDPGASAGAGMDDSGQTGEPVSIWA